MKAIKSTPTLGTVPPCSKQPTIGVKLGSSCGLYANYICIQASHPPATEATPVCSSHMLGSGFDAT